MTFWHIPWHLGNSVQAHKHGPLGEKAGRCCYQWMVQSNFWSVFYVQICLHAAQFSLNVSSKEKLPESDREKFQTQPLIKPSLMISFKIHLHLLAPLEWGQLCFSFFCPASAAKSYFNTTAIQPDRFPPRNLQFTFASVNHAICQNCSFETFWNCHLCTQKKRNCHNCICWQFFSIWTLNCYKAKT